jgi:hypothetical protein
MAEQLILPRRTELHEVRWFVPDRRSYIVICSPVMQYAVHVFSGIFLIAVRRAVTAGCSYVARFLLCCLTAREFSLALLPTLIPRSSEEEHRELRGE